VVALIGRGFGIDARADDRIFVRQDSPFRGESFGITRRPRATRDRKQPGKV
jgi:hypothetical protein